MSQAAINPSTPLLNVDGTPAAARSGRDLDTSQVGQEPTTRFARLDAVMRRQRRLAALIVYAAVPLVIAAGIAMASLFG